MSTSSAAKRYGVFDGLLCSGPSAKAEKGLLRGTQRRIENVTLAEACVLEIKAVRQIGNGDAIVARPHVVDAESAVSSDNARLWLHFPRQQDTGSLRNCTRTELKPANHLAQCSIPHEGASFAERENHTIHICVDVQHR
jgi:hypothetical protein